MRVMKNTRITLVSDNMTYCFIPRRNHHMSCWQRRRKWIKGEIVFTVLLSVSVTAFNETSMVSSWPVCQFTGQIMHDITVYWYNYELLMGKFDLRSFGVILLRWLSNNTHDHEFNIDIENTKAHIGKPPKRPTIRNRKA